MISVIIPSLNQRMFLADALRSALNQSFRDLEVIVIDGGSDDDSLEILKSLAASDRRLRWSSGRDGGPAEAINKGFAIAKGESMEERRELAHGTEQSDITKSYDLKIQW
jgi:CDP-glycerol glycerophosphotransferase